MEGRPSSRTRTHSETARRPDAHGGCGGGNPIALRSDGREHDRHRKSVFVTRRTDLKSCFSHLQIVACPRSAQTVWCIQTFGSQ